MFTWAETDLTMPACGAVMVDSIFMLSTTTSGSPARTVSPGATSTATTNAGAGQRTWPPSSRVITCGVPSISITSRGPELAATTR